MINDLIAAVIEALAAMMLTFFPAAAESGQVGNCVENISVGVNAPIVKVDC